MTLYFNNSLSFSLQHTLISTHINLDSFEKLANLRRELRHIKSLCSALVGGPSNKLATKLIAVGD